MEKRLKWILLSMVVLILAAGIIGYLIFKGKKVVEWTPVNSLKPSTCPVLMDEMDAETLIQAIDNSLRYFEKADPETTVSFSNQWVDNKRVKETLLDFKSKLLELGLSEDFFQYIKQNYRFFRSASSKTLFTGYYEADLHGSLMPSATYCYPLYKKPDDLLKVDLSKFYFFDKYKGLPSELRARVSETDPKTVIPYFNRSEIDDHRILSGQDLELVWCDNPIDVFFLQIQGSGIVQLDTGETMRVNYADKNGHPYRAIGKLLLEQNAISYENMSMQSIRQYLETHPEKLKEVFNFNPSYVFFREVDEGPIGCLGVPVTPFRSIATDRNLFPKGALVYIETQIPVFNQQDEVIGWKNFRGFVLNQDTGGAIRTPARVDLFTGYGKESRLTAGHLKQTGIFYFLLK